MVSSLPPRQLSLTTRLPRLLPSALPTFSISNRRPSKVLSSASRPLLGIPSRCGHQHETYVTFRPRVAILPAKSYPPLSLPYHHQQPPCRYPSVPTQRARLLWFPFSTRWKRRCLRVLRIAQPTSPPFRKVTTYKTTLPFECWEEIEMINAAFAYPSRPTILILRSEDNSNQRIFKP